MSTIYENLRKHVRSVSIMNENVSKPDVRKPLIETSTRFEPLSFLNDENQNESQYVEQKQNDETASKKVMIIGNCHIRYIRTNNFVQNCSVKILSAKSCEEVGNKIDEIDTDCDLIVLHIFSNDVRNLDHEKCVKVHDDLISKLQRQCQFAKIVISLPDTSIYEKIECCIVLVKYKYLTHARVQICENSSLNNFGSPVKIIFARDEIHLSEEGMTICITYIKFAIRRSLKLENMCRRRSVQTNYGNSNQIQSEVPPQMYPYQPGFMFPIPPNNMTNMQPPGLKYGDSQLFQPNMYAQAQHDFGIQYHG